MVTDNHYRWDFIGLSTDQKPTPATSDKVVDGSTFYCSDNSKLYVYCKDNWYERKALGGGGGGTSDFNKLSNRPKYKNSEMTGATNIKEFTGTDGNTAGAEGLVPAPATADADKFLKSDGTWSTAGGGGVTPVQTTGASTTDVMSQDATTKLLYPDITNTPYKMSIGQSLNQATAKGVAINGYIHKTSVDSIAIGCMDSSYAIVGSNGRSNYSLVVGRNALSGRGDGNVVLGTSAQANSGQNTGYDVAVGYSANAGAGSYTHSVALGSYATSTRSGEVNIGTGSSGNGYNSTNYRVIGGVHDGVDAHDAATVAQGNTLATSAPTTSTVGVLGQLYTDTTNMHTYQCTAISGDTYTWTQRW